MEYAIYTGKNSALIVRDARLSKIYKLVRGVGVRAASEDDMQILLMQKEPAGGCCGAIKTLRSVVWRDSDYCKWQGLDLEQMRAYWANIST